MEIAKMDFVKLFFGRTDLQTLRKTNKVKNYRRHQSYRYDP